MEYYLIEFFYNEKKALLIWYSDENDGVIVNNGRVVFDSKENVMAYCIKNAISLSEESNQFNYDEVISCIDKTYSSENCIKILDLWNFFSDVSASLKTVFMGDSHDDAVSELYDKIVHGCNIEMLKHEEYHPVLSDDEKNILFEIMKNGRSLIDSNSICA